MQFLPFLLIFLFLVAPVKRRTSLCRSYSFSCRSSPRRFYAVKRTTSTNMEKTSIKTQNKFENTTADDNVKNILFSNFTNEDFTEIDTKEPNDDKNEKHQVNNISNRRKTRRNIFNLHHNSSDTSGVESLSLDSSEYLNRSGSLKRRASIISSCESLEKRQCVSTNEKSDEMLPWDLKENETNDANAVASQCHVTSRTKFGSETTMDWLAEMENEEVSNVPSELSFHGALEKLSRTPAADESKMSPSIHTKIKGLTDTPNSIKSPTVVKAGNETITVSPLLSVTSLEFLEKAPILSPAGSTKKTRKRRALNVEYTN